MKFLRAVSICMLGVALLTVLQLPDAWSDRPDRRYANLPDADFAAAAGAAWKGGQRGGSLLLADYCFEQKMPSAGECARLRDGYWAALQQDATPLGRLTALGLGPVQVNANWYDGLSGQSVADYFVYGAQLPAGAAAGDPLPGLLRDTRDAVASAFPPAAPALALAGAADAADLLTPPLAEQLAGALQAFRAASNNAASLGAVQEALMPLFQLARQCKSWAEYAALLKSADSVDQVKALTRIASAAPRNALKLARILTVAGARGAAAPAACIGCVMQNGAACLENLHAALRKGPAGLALAVQYPTLPAATLNHAPGSFPLLIGRAGLAAWQAMEENLGVVAAALKYGGVILLCGAIFALLLPWRLFRDRFAPASPLATLRAEHVRGAYWGGILLAALTVGLLLALSALAPPPPAAEPAATGSAAAGTPVAAAAEPGNQTLSLAILMAVIFLVQGTCWWVARRKLRDIERDEVSDPALKLKRLDNLDIFFDLPLYCGLALTIFAFILISTFGAGVSRFLAYSSTFVGIVFAVILRVGHLYPLRERLIDRK